MARGMTMVLAAALAVLLLASPVAMAGRPGPVEANKFGAVDFPPHHQQKAAAEGAGCEGVNDEHDECMARRTLAAHTDYIYTQEHHH